MLILLLIIFHDEMQHIDTKPQQDLIEHIESKSKISISKSDLVKKITAKAEENVKMNFSWEFLAKEFSDILEKYHYK